jgi:hypothetical protein
MRPAAAFFTGRACRGERIPCAVLMRRSFKRLRANVVLRFQTGCEGVDTARAATKLTAKRAKSRREHAIGATVPFSKYDLDPEHIEAMRAAFHRVCDVLQLDCGREDPMTDIVVMKIVEIATAGELDPERLCIDTLAALESSPAEPSPASAATEGAGARAS